MPHKSVTFRGSRSGPRRAVDWAISIQDSGFTALAAVTTANLGGGLALSGISTGPFTIIRIRGLLSIATDQEAQSEVQVGALGITVVTLRAAAAGVASLPRPQSDPFADWMLYESFAQRFRFVSGVGVGWRTVHQYVLDSKAMRKIDAPSEQSLAVMIENAGGNVIEHSIHLRALVKFH